MKIRKVKLEKRKAVSDETDHELARKYGWKRMYDIYVDDELVGIMYEMWKKNYVILDLNNEKEYHGKSMIWILRNMRRNTVCAKHGVNHLKRWLINCEQAGIKQRLKLQITS